MLPQYVNRQICIVGRVLSSNDRGTTLEASDRQQVQIHTRGMTLPQQSIVEIIGQVNPDLSISESNRTAFSENFNLDTYEELMKLTQKNELQPLFGRV
jgi:hypothetical protein